MSLLLRRLYTSASTAAPSTSAVANSLLQRNLPSIRDWITPQPSHLLSLSLSPYLNTTVQRDSPRTKGNLPPGHHLVYFPPQVPEHLLLPDGSDKEQSPGGPWVRRMWAGGSIEFSKTRPLRMFDEAILKERVESVREKDGKLFVWFERRVFPVPESDEPSITERRCLVFMGARTGEQAQLQMRVLRPPQVPDFVETFVPTQHLLFRFSALTFNAHRIHYDTPFSVGEELFKGNLCHGPLAVTFLLGMLERELKPGQRVKSFEYKCLAPMYVGESYRIAGKWKENGEKVELWAETPEGGYSVRAVAEVETEEEGVD